MRTHDSQHRTGCHLGALAVVLAFLCQFLPLVSATPAAAADVVKFTITVPMAFMRDTPSLVARNTVQVFKGEWYRVSGRSADNTWLQLDEYAPNGAGTWFLQDLGAVAQGKLGNVPVISTTVKPLPMGRAVAYSAWIPTITPQMHQIYGQSVKYGKDVGMFTVVGDCNSLPPVYVQRIAAGLFNLSKASALQSVVTRFAKSFSRISLAANGGFNSAAMMDPDWADHALCDATAGPFACEVWVSRASVVFIEVGTGDQYTWKDFEKNYRPLIEHALKKGVLPVLVTKADDLEAKSGAASGYINGVIRRLAKEYGVPLLDFWLATRTLPNNGLLNEGGLNFHLSPAGRDLHLIATLQTLDAISR